jgi:hypothetical protein
MTTSDLPFTLPSSDLSSAGGVSDVMRLRATIAGFGQIATPLLQAVLEVQNAAGDGGGDASSRVQAQAANLSQLVDSGVDLARHLGSGLGATPDSLDDWVRWALAGSSSQCVASYYRATAKPMPSAEAEKFVGLLQDMMAKFRALGPVGSENVANTAGTFRAKMMEALSPVVGAVAQYAFGRSEHVLVAEIAERLLKAADQVTRSLAPGSCSAQEWRLLCWSVLKSAAQLYTECHYGEADRLWYMNPDERAAYFAQHGNQVPMDRVWQAFNQRLSLIATLAAYIQLPDSARLDEPGWQ